MPIMILHVLETTMTKEKLRLVKKEFLKQLKKVPFILITPQRLQQLLEKFMIMQKKMDLDL